MGVVHEKALVDETARVDPGAVIGDGVEIGAYCIVGPGVTIGAGCRLRAHAMVVAHTEMGVGNVVHSHAVVGGEPQDLSYTDTDPGRVFIGDRNTFREGVTINRGAKGDEPTRVGNDCYLMAGSHCGHNVQVGDNVVIGNGSMMGGHVHVGNRANISGLVCVHQFVMVGEGVMMRGGSGIGMHLPPYVIAEKANRVAGLNKIGLARNPEMEERDVREVKELYRAFYRDRRGGAIMKVLKRMENREWGTAGTRFVRFMGEALRAEKPRDRGVCGSR